MKRSIFVSIAICIFSGTSLNTTAQNRINTSGFNEAKRDSRSIHFIEGIEIKGSNNFVNQVPAKALSTDQQNLSNSDIKEEFVPAIECFSGLQFKFAQMLNLNVEEIKNIPLYNFIEEWWETGYRFGGTEKNGIDCSALTGQLMSTVFNIKLPRTAKEQFTGSEKINRESLAEGDLVFFKMKRSISHVGVYLGNGYFVHASRNNGVTISSLEDPYYNKHFAAAGRVIGNDNTTSYIYN